MLKNKEKKSIADAALKTKNSNNKCTVNVAIKNEFEVYEAYPRISKGNNILEFWEQKKLEIPLLYEAAQVVLAVPATQVSVERAFSALKFVLSPQRVHLTEQSLRNILFVRLNENFFEK